MSDWSKLSRRERQIMETIYTYRKATTKQVLGGMQDPPTRTAVRTLLRILESKGHLRHTVQGREFVYHPVQSRARTGRLALRNVLDTFFQGSIERALAAYLSESSSRVRPDELDRLAGLVVRYTYR